MGCSEEEHALGYYMFADELVIIQGRKEAAIEKAVPMMGQKSAGMLCGGPGCRNSRNVRNVLSTYSLTNN